MDTGLGSPRSSSGYGSSEEDHQASKGSRRRRRKNAVATGTGRLSAPQTPQSLSPSDTGSSLSSPFSIDFRSVFDDTMPDFSDLTALSEPDDVQLPVDLIGTWNDEFDARPLIKPTAVDAPRTGDDNHILVSLLKRPKAELDWITTGQQPPPEQVLCGGGEVTGTSRVTLNVDKVASASPLQRLKALTQSDVVNHVSQPPSTTRSPVMSVPAPAVPVRVVNLPPSDGLFYHGRTPPVPPPLVVPPRSRISAMSSTVSVADARQCGGPRPVSRPVTDCPPRGRSLPTVTHVHRVCLELDDHRYSSTIAQRPWPSSVKPCRSRRASVNGRCPPRRPPAKMRPTSSSSSSLSSSSSSVLEMLLRTSKRLRPNDGSDATLQATCRDTPPVKRPSSRRRAPPSVAAVSSTPCGRFTSLLDSMLADRDAVLLSTDDGAAAATTSSTCAGELPVATPSDSFSLFSEHLLCDSQGIIDVGLFTDDQPAWTPSRLDDKVTRPPTLLSNSCISQLSLDA